MGTGSMKVKVVSYKCSSSSFVLKLNTVITIIIGVYDGNNPHRIQMHDGSNRHPVWVEGHRLYQCTVDLLAVDKTCTPGVRQ